MARPARVVEHLRLRGESESAVRHVLPALADAFRTASLPDAGARLVCVRRLQLGRVPTNGSPQTVALLIEKHFAEAAWKVVHGGESGADSAEAVWFRDAFEAHETAALRIAAGQTLDAWFWPLAIPAVTAVASDERLRMIALAIAAMEEAPAALPAWTASVVRAGYRQELISALRPGDGPALLRAAGVTRLPSEYTTGAGVTSHETPGSPVAGRTADVRATFVDAIASRALGHLPQPPSPIAHRSATRSTPSADGIAAAAETRARAHGGQPADGSRLLPSREGVPEHRVDAPKSRIIQDAGPPDTATEHQPAELVSPARGPAHRATSSPRAPSERRAEGFTDSDRVAAASGESDHAIGEPLAHASPWQIPHAAPTAAGGLLFLLPVLEWVGFGVWAAEGGLEQRAPDVVAAEILHLLLSRLRVDEDDPMWTLAAPFRLKPEATRSNKERRPRSQAPPGFRLQPEGCEVASTWLTRCRRYLRRRVRIGLASLVVRHARVAITPTHVDVFFRLDAADARVRRAGLDIDPGWVRWFGRVVTFHYEDRPWN